MDNPRVQFFRIPGRLSAAKTALMVVIFLSVLLMLFLYETKASGAVPEPRPGSPVVGPAPQKAKDVFIPEPDDFSVETFVENLEVPWELVFLPDGRALVTERRGRIRVIEDGKLLHRPYARIKTSAAGEGGLLGLALHPEYPRQPYLYIMFTYRKRLDLFNKVVRLRDNGSSAVFDRMIVEKIPGARYHDGGRIAFGPDRMLYVCTGDGTKPERAQDRGSLGGKILRFAPDGSIPQDNPFSGSPVYASGLRNPQGLAWDMRTGDLYASDHGPTGEFGLYGKDSIKCIQKGGNYGWPLVLGAAHIRSYTDPIVFWEQTTPPAGMAFFNGNLYVATLKSQSLIRIGFRKEGRGCVINSIERLFASDWARGRYGRIRNVVAGPDNKLYLLTSNRDGRGSPQKGDDRILRLTPR